MRHPFYLYDPFNSAGKCTLTATMRPVPGGTAE